MIEILLHPAILMAAAFGVLVGIASIRFVDDDGEPFCADCGADLVSDGPLCARCAEQREVRS